MIDLELIQRARNANLLDYLNSQGYRLMKSSAREYRLFEHDSLVISNNRWNWFSRDIGGNTLDFLLKYENKSFNTAVEILTGVEIKFSTEQQRELFITTPMNDIKVETSVLILPPKSKDFHRVFAYLNKTRKIDSTIIADLMHKEKLYQSDRNNCVFVGNDKNGTIRFACERGTFT